MAPLHSLGLAEVAQRLRDGALTAEAYTEACLARIRALEPRVQAWVTLDEDRARALARAADRRRANARGSQAGRLSGVPIAVKDLIDVAGLPSGMGSALYRDYRPARSAGVVRRLERAGAFALGKAVTTEFAFMVPSKTRNPWNPAHTPGGSSSGSAAAVACGMVPAGIGTQTNGSVIRPAAFCGVVGFKPDVDSIPVDGVLPFSPTFDTPGVFARSVRDAALLASWLTRQDGVIARDVIPLRRPPTLVAVRSPVWEKAEPAGRDRFAADIARLREAGAAITERELPSVFETAHAVHRRIMLKEAALAAAPVRRTHRDALSDFLNAALDEGEATSDAAYRAALDTRAALIRAVTDFLDTGGFDAIVTPPAAGEAPAGLETTGDPAFCTLWTLLGIPAITIPTGLGPRGLPLGLQILARPRAANTLVAVAEWCEARSPFPPPDHPHPAR